MFAGWIPFNILASAVLSEAGLPENAVLFASIPYMFGWMAVGYWRSKFPCPRCGRKFLLRNGNTTVRSRHCMHCGLPKFAPADPGIEQRLEFERGQSPVGVVFDRLCIPLAVASVVLGLGSLFITSPTFQTINSICIVIGNLLPIYAVTTIRGMRIKPLIKENVPRWIRILFPVVTLLAISIGLQRIFWSAGGFHLPLVEEMFNYSPSRWEIILSTSMSLMALYSARRVRRSIKPKA